MNATNQSVVDQRETDPVSSVGGKVLSQAAAKSAKVDLDQIYINKGENIRGLNSDAYTDEQIGEMAAQIEGVGGLLQPIGVVAVKAGPDTENKPFMLVWGFRRALALQYLAESDPKWGKQVPVRLIEKGAETTGTTRLIQLMENTARADLNPMETAQAIQEALNDKSCEFSQKDIARILGKSTGAVSQHLKLLRFPKEIQDKISTGNLPFSHAREILFRVPETAWANVAKKAAGMTFGAFDEWLKKEYGSEDAESDGEVTAAGEKPSSQKPAKMLRATDVTNKYLPFLKKQIEQADKSNKAFTAEDLAKARLDAVQTILLNNDTQLAHDIDPFLKELEAQEEASKQKEATEKAEEAYYRKLVKRVEELYVPKDPADPDTRPLLTQVYSQVGKEVYVLSAEEKAKLGFELPTPEAFLEKLAKTYHQVLVDRVEAKKKRDEAKAKKAAEEAAKQPAAQGA